jgi:KaiC/GvpD/RAD55 family RecA-like ATPase
MALYKFEETADDLLTRARSRPWKTGLHFIDSLTDRGFAANDVIEVCGDTGTGKTTVSTKSFVPRVLFG